ncbi:MAG: NAD-dependent succinate-semialdehyde dehydrogenase, partial [Gordonia sp. (in: high G+C Gram-positive bacteria)]
MSDTDVLDPQAVLAAVPTGLWIGGESVDATGSGTFEVIAPATEEPIATVADATVADA